MGQTEALLQRNERPASGVSFRFERESWHHARDGGDANAGSLGARHGHLVDWAVDGVPEDVEAHADIAN